MYLNPICNVSVMLLTDTLQIHYRNITETRDWVSLKVGNIDGESCKKKMQGINERKYTYQAGRCVFP